MFLLTFFRPSGSSEPRVERQHLQPLSGEVRQAIDGRAPEVPVPCSKDHQWRVHRAGRGSGLQGGGSRSRGGPLLDCTWQLELLLESFVVGEGLGYVRGDFGGDEVGPLGAALLSLRV